MDSSQITLRQFKQNRVRELPDTAGVYALCDLDEVPIYVGQAEQSRDTSIRKRVQRHITSARSDIIANRQLDVWEVGYVWAWEAKEPAPRLELEAQMFYLFDNVNRLINGSVPSRPSRLMRREPAAIKIQVLPDEVIKLRRDPAIRFPRQVQQFNQLLDYILNTQDKSHLRRALRVHHDRLTKQLNQFLATHETVESEDDGD